jgi:hypothetical protein
MLTQKQIEDFNVEMRAIQLKYGVEIQPVIQLQIKEVIAEPSIPVKKPEIEEGKITELPK